MKHVQYIKIAVSVCARKTVVTIEAGRLIKTDINN